jgi:hypothetical protein
VKLGFLTACSDAGTHQIHERHSFRCMESRLARCRHRPMGIARGRTERDHPKVREAEQPGNDFRGQSLGQGRKISVGATVLERQHGDPEIRSAGKELGARYVIEGSLRQAGSRLRIATQLVDASSGVNLWAETHDRPFRLEAIFELQDDVVPRIVSTVADTHGVLPHTMSEVLRNWDPGRLSPYEAVLRSFAHFQRVSAEEHAGARAGLERAVQQAPDYADGWAMLSMMYKERVHARV